MCGIVGFAGNAGNQAEGSAVLRAMLTRLHHRGPDNSGVWNCPEQGVYLGHARLSILDISPTGHQPMRSQSERYQIVFNGEIYNFREIRSTLEAVGVNSWRGTSDTEVLLAAFDHWGIKEALTRLVGMFAFAVWDEEEKVLTLARDRMGEKPLYYGRVGKAFAFASELKSLRAMPDFDNRVSRESLAVYLRHNYIPAPYSIYEGISKVPPGAIVQYRPAQDKLTQEKYWSLESVAVAGCQTPFAGSDDEAIEELERLLMQSIRGQMISDVPLGAFLSGGIDSSLVVALMQAQSSQPVKTFSIGFHEAAYNEAGFAKDVAKHLHTDHTELYVSPQDSMEVIPKLPQLFDEPFADSSQIPTFLVSQLARQQVTVSLSGDGGDELFGGYVSYPMAEMIWKRISLFPRPLRVLAGSAISGIPTSWLDRATFLDGIVNRLGRSGPVGQKLKRAARLFPEPTPGQLFRSLSSNWDPPNTIAHTSHEPATAFTQSYSIPTSSLQQQFMFLDAISYLPDDILTKVDRASMGVSLESRVPLLDHRIVEFSWRLPFEMKVRDGVGKWILRNLLYRHVPRKLVERPKSGFSVPVGDWIKGPLRDWAEDLLSNQRLASESYFRPDVVRQKWNEHLTGQRNWSQEIWGILMFQAWAAEW